jgi:Asp-tRNA(Asn)/Glu-tRNA(Gln) amidotransferase A subunit family amidase
MPTPFSPLVTLTEWLSAPRAVREAAIAQCSARIRDLDGEIRAWREVRPQPPTGDGPLAEIPFGAKDIIETRGLPTEYGSAIYAGRVGTDDAAIVRELRGRGAILLGKTHTTAFAYKTPAPTRNPRDLAHTPGGSSSGSAAAVAAGMVPFALGTQTRGSILRPASYCGVVGFKPSYGRLPMDGVLAFAHSLDTLGFFTHTAADALELWSALGHSRGREESVALGAPEPLPSGVEPAMARAFEDALARLSRAGVAIEPLDIAAMLDALDAANLTVTFYEGARFHERRCEEHGARMHDMADLVRDGLRIPTERYEEAKRYIAACRVEVAALYASTPVILVPAATGPAPRGLESTGDPRMNAPWTALGTPALSIPLPLASGLPLGLQLTAADGDDARVLRTGVRLEALLRA